MVRLPKQSAIDLGRKLVLLSVKMGGEEETGWLVSGGKVTCVQPEPATQNKVKERDRN